MFFLTAGATVATKGGTSSAWDASRDTALGVWLGVIMAVGGSLFFACFARLDLLGRVGINIAATSTNALYEFKIRGMENKVLPETVAKLKETTKLEFAEFASMKKVLSMCSYEPSFLLPFSSVGFGPLRAPPIKLIRLYIDVAELNALLTRNLHSMFFSRSGMEKRGTHVTQANPLARLEGELKLAEEDIEQNIRLYGHYIGFFAFASNAPPAGRSNGAWWTRFIIRQIALREALLIKYVAGKAALGVVTGDEDSEDLIARFALNSAYAIFANNFSRIRIAIKKNLAPNLRLPMLPEVRLQF